MTKTRIYLLTIVTGLLLALPVSAQTPYAQPDDSWISISGTVITPTAESFLLDYGDGMITVEMDDWDWYRETHSLLDGDWVTVYGQIDDDLFEAAKIEASSVYVENLNSVFYASAADEEDMLKTAIVPIDLSTTVVQGTVAGVNGREFTVNTGTGRLTVDTSEMSYNPLDDKGFQRVRVGGVVRVSGDVDLDLFEERELMADAVITLAKDSPNTNSR